MNEHQRKKSPNLVAAMWINSENHSQKSLIDSIHKGHLAKRVNHIEKTHYEINQNFVAN